MFCSIEGCFNRGPFRRGWCDKHYRRWQKHGDPLYRKRVAAGEPMEFILAVAARHEGAICLDWPFARFGNGYANIRGKSACNIICELAKGAAPSEMHQAAHSCGRGDQGCVSGAHLRWALPKENQADRKDHGTYVKGEQMPWARLTEVQVREILGSHEPYKAIAERFDISCSNVSMIRTGRSWRHVAK